MEKWDFEDLENPDLEMAQDAERRRQLWRAFRRDNTAYMTLRAQSGFTHALAEPNENEPRDLERFFDDLEDAERAGQTQTNKNANKQKFGKKGGIRTPTTQQQGQM